uniref:Uncharacterized protein n=1 Tax=Phage sp. cty4N14 TaxID=2825799 RepID=A0A8S5U508_9VIRU|nr:MAG TPA: hypothetical protein [Phage sp. cty4N14]DAR83274.1 MAG TPA: hypothetical protein [Caudoviricetes sp.]
MKRKFFKNLNRFLKDRKFEKPSKYTGKCKNTMSYFMSCFMS